MDRTRRLAVSLALNAALVVVQVAFGIVAHSSGLLADAGHNLVDVGALALSMVTVLIVVESVHRLAHPEPVRAGIVVAVASFGLIVNGVAALVLHDRSNDLNMRAALLHMMGDALASLAVIVGAVILLFTPSATWLDPVSALVVAAIIVYQAFGLFRGSVTVLLESTPSDVDLAELTSTMEGVAGG